MHATSADLFAPAELPVPTTRPARPGLGDVSAGFEIGWDYAHYRLTPPPEALADGHPVRQGWQAGGATFGARTLKPTRHVRKWLQLRLSAWRRGRAFEGTLVTPNFLAQIDVPVCPVTRVVLTHSSGSGSDASVDRVCNQAGYAAGNLAVISTRANEAKADLGCRDALTVVRQLEASGMDTLDGLDALQWSRLGVLMSFVTPMGHAEAACLPLLVLPPNRLRLINAVQALQAVVTLAFTQPQAVPRMRELMTQAPAVARHDFQVFVLTLQARRLAIGMRSEGFVAHRPGDPVGAENDRAAGRHLAEFLDEHRALGAQVVADELVVHDLVAHVDRHTELFERAFDDGDGPFDAGTEAAGVGEKDLHGIP